MKNQFFNPLTNPKIDQYCSNQLSILGYDIEKIMVVNYEFFNDHITLFIQDISEFRKPLNECIKVKISLESFISFDLKDFSTEILQQELKKRGFCTNRLWHTGYVDDIIETLSMDKEKFSESEKMDILEKSLQDDTTYSKIWDLIEDQLYIKNSLK